MRGALANLEDDLRQALDPLIVNRERIADVCRRYADLYQSTAITRDSLVPIDISDTDNEEEA